MAAHNNREEDTEGRPGTYRAGAMTFGPTSTANGTYHERTVGPPQTDPLVPDPGGPRRTLLIVVVSDVERDAVLAEVLALTGADPAPRHLPKDTVFELGQVERLRVVLAQVGQGTVTPDSAGGSAQDLVAGVAPDYVVLTGVCYGLREDHPKDPQRIGDVIVATQVRLIGHYRASEADDHKPGRIERGGQVHPSKTLLSRFRAAAVGWWGTVHFGPIVSESVLVAQVEHRERIRTAEPEALGGEMESSAIYLAAFQAKVDWAVVKGISDWGHSKVDKGLRPAAANAASFLATAIQTGGFDPVEG